jgi:hypothetical protein
MEQVLTRLIGQKGVESEYGISIEVQEKLRREKAFAPWLKVGRRVFYVRTELDRWLQDQQAKTMAPQGGGNDAA